MCSAACCTLHLCSVLFAMHSVVHTLQYCWLARTMLVARWQYWGCWPVFTLTHHRQVHCTLYTPHIYTPCPCIGHQRPHLWCSRPMSACLHPIPAPGTLKMLQLLACLVVHHSRGMGSVPGQRHWSNSLSPMFDRSSICSRPYQVLRRKPKQEPSLTLSRYLPVRQHRPR